MEGRVLGCFLLINLIQSAFAYRPSPRGESMLLFSLSPNSPRLSRVFVQENPRPCHVFLCFLHDAFSVSFAQTCSLRRCYLIFSADCLHEVDEGPCLDDVPRYYYNTLTQRCEEFSYGGCEGNANNFKSYVACHKTCYSIPST